MSDTNKELFDTIESRIDAMEGTEYKRADIIKEISDIDEDLVDRFIYYSKRIVRVKRGVYSLKKDNPTVVEQKAKVVSPHPQPQQEAANTELVTCGEESVYIPEVNPLYVSWGNSKSIYDIVKSKQFFPTYISGQSGNGKTMAVEQSCAKAKREYIRVQITLETDEDDLIGGFRLVNGETVFAEGPVIKAMKHGAVLLIDEIDRGSNKIMCLQGVLEGKPVLIKKTGKLVHPAPGFQIIASGNSKGRGSDDGKYASSILDDAFLERFIVTIEQPYPSEAIERKILGLHAESFGVNDNEFIEKLVLWAQSIRKTFFETDGAGISDFITTRRLCHIIHTHSIFNNRKKSVELCVNRFDDDVKEAFIDLYSKIDAGEDVSTADGNELF